MKNVNELDLVFTISINNDNQFTTLCKARNLDTNEVTKYQRTEMSARQAMESIINYLTSKGYSIYNVTFSALNIG